MERALVATVRRLCSEFRRLPAGTGSNFNCSLQVNVLPVRHCSSGRRSNDEDKALLDRIIRVDHAGEYGANRIYAGQMAVLGRSSVGPIIQAHSTRAVVTSWVLQADASPEETCQAAVWKSFNTFILHYKLDVRQSAAPKFGERYYLLLHMWNQEKDHLKKFNELMVAHRVRPTVLLPFWNVAGFVLGAGTALLGKKGAMACTVAVEATISEHYNNQIRSLMERDPEKHRDLLQTIKTFRDEELEHHDIGLEHDAELAPAYSLLKNVIQVGCRAAVFLSERV